MDTAMWGGGIRLTTRIHLVFAGGVTNRPKGKRRVFVNQMIGWSVINAQTVSVGLDYHHRSPLNPVVV